MKFLDKDDKKLLLIFFILAFLTFLAEYFSSDRFLIDLLKDFIMPIETGMTFFLLGKH